MNVPPSPLPIGSGHAMQPALVQEAEQLQQLLNQEIASSLGKSLSLDQCKQGYIRLPIVPKQLSRGPRGSLFYVNQKGRRVYLNGPQKNRLAEQKLPGVIGVPAVLDAGPLPRRHRRSPDPEFGQGPPGSAGNPVFIPGQLPQSVFQRVDAQLAIAQRL